VRRDRWSALGLAVFALGYLAAGRAYPLDTLAAPGPGVFPLVAGTSLLLLAGWQFATAGRRPAGRRAADLAGPPARALPVMAAGLVLYALALPRLGFVPASFALVVLAARLMGCPGWWRPAALALGVVLASRVLFGTWLGVPLP
jgi:hypothetical protein